MLNIHNTNYRKEESQKKKIQKRKENALLKHV